MTHWILAINPGSTSTKLALFEDEVLYTAETLRHNPQELAPVIADQLEYRTALVSRWLEANFNGDKLSAVVGRGGMLKPIPSGTYAVNERMREDLRKGVGGQHASNLGGLIAHSLASRWGIPAFIVDPVSVDEFIPEARISGIPEIERRSRSHALNIRAVARRAARDLGHELEDINLIVAHLGGGISVAPLQKGRMLDVNDANEMGPFSPERSGGLPTGDLVKLAFSGKYTQEELVNKILRGSGLLGYLGTNDGVEVGRRIQAGDKKAELIGRAMAYQIAKEIGAMATVLCGQVRAIIITGGLAHYNRLTGWIKEHVRFIAPVLIYPGEDELQALAAGCLRVLRGEESPREYQ
ncbi:MAG TPA: butyrate kinase [Bacillota bacterium]|nr:butyrate kinase [Bacillota bacterium]HPZ90344.1 butyrate kinase [Bacillota bacterium]HQE01849.1 butyrate kinase [Bacillota bacterium]